MIFFTFKLIFISCLSLVFLLCFGYPSYKKFQQKDTVVTEEQISTDPMKPLMITIFPWEHYTYNGWKENHNHSGTLDELCNTPEEYEDIVKCIDEKTFKHDDVIEKYTEGEHPSENDVTNDTIWTEGLTTIFTGKSFSMKVKYADADDDAWRVYFKNDLNYTILIHDPDFYVFTIIPNIIPKIKLNFEDSRSQLIYIDATYHQKMDRPSRPCTSSKTYSFTRCVADFVSGRVGCSWMFDNLGSRDLPDCSTAAQIQKMQWEYYLLWRKKQKNLIKHTGCYPPCTYVEYKLAEMPEIANERV